MRIESRIVRRIYALYRNVFVDKMARGRCLDCNEPKIATRRVFDMSGTLTTGDHDDNKKKSQSYETCQLFAMTERSCVAYGYHLLARQLNLCMALVTGLGSMCWVCIAIQNHIRTGREKTIRRRSSVGAPQRSQRWPGFSSDGLSTLSPPLPLALRCLSRSYDLY